MEELIRHKQGIQLGVPATADARCSIILPIYLDSYITADKSFGNFIEYGLTEKLSKKLRKEIDLATIAFAKRYGRISKKKVLNMDIIYFIEDTLKDRVYKGTVYNYECKVLTLRYNGKALLYHVMFSYMQHMRKIVYNVLKECKPKYYKQTRKRKVLHTYEEYADGKLKEFKGSAVDQLKKQRKDSLPF